jgi:hypothetical protein
MSEQVHIRVGEGRKEKWDAHATEDHADKDGSVSKLIRHAVERQIEMDSGDTPVGPSDGAQTVEPNGRIDDILTGVENNGSALEEIQNRLARLHDDVVSGGMPEPEVVFSEVYGAVPAVEDGFTDADESAIATEFGATVEEIADDVEMTVEEVSRALIQLHYEYDDVGNWIRRVEMEAFGDNEPEVYEIRDREITYH